MNTQIKYYSGIDDILLYNWEKCTNGLVNYCRINATDEDILNNKDIESWDKIYSKYIEIYGINKKYSIYLKKSLKLAKLQNKYVITSKKMLIPLIEILQNELNIYKKELNTGGVDIDTTLIHIGKWYGQILDKKKITAKFYFDLRKQYENSININRS